ncbi:MAG: AAA family ATPase [Eubacteriales bacterium]|nr:AAA family ATPase [Eubacteriales bacterium]
MSISEVIEQVWQWCEAFGGKHPGDYVRRINVADAAFAQGGAFFACIQPDETPSGAYHDFSLVVFPDEADGPWLVSLGIGSLGFRNDFELASLPGIRRRYMKLISDHGYIKTDFTDISTSIDSAYIDNAPNLKKSIDMYRKVLPACEIIQDINTSEGLKKVKAFLALYADIRGWPTNNSHRSAVRKAIEDGTEKVETVPDDVQVYQLLNERKYLVLQGAPGTGKTRLAKQMAQRLSAKPFFTQFHAETSYADFVWGIRPKLQNDKLAYESIRGPFVQALAYALANPEQNVLLIIDEINRANLSNVLGPVFYLFEYQMRNSLVELPITDDLSIDKLPKNLFVIATMNTADRSLAVVDFALRRRFSWYELQPQPITPDNGLQFFKSHFDSILSIFEQYARDEEFCLMPGQGYFIAKDEAEMNNRLRYELMPLVKEYLAEGLISAGRDSFVNYFRERINQAMFR